MVACFVRRPCIGRDPARHSSRVEVRIDALGRMHTMSFDPVGNPLVRMDARGYPTTYSHDPLNRETGWWYRDDTRSTTVYDAAGREIGMQDPWGTLSYLYDRAGRRTAAIDAATNKRLTYAFDLAGRPTQMRDDALHTYDYRYLADGHLLEILNVYGQRFTFGYDPVGRMTRRELANGVTVNRTFDAAGREVLRENLKADGSALGVYTATYDPVGNRLTVQEFDGTLVTHEYDALYRLVTDQRDGSYSFNRTYTYDEVGNRLTKSDSGALCTYGYDQADQLLRVGPWGSYAYPTNWSSDANGNLVTENYVGNITNYTFDTENRLVKVVQPSGYTEENRYSQDGLRRVRLAGTSTITYLWDDHVLLRDYGIYTTLPGAPGVLLASKGGTTHRFYAPDMQGHVRQVTDINGGIIAAYLYDAWGLIADTNQTAMAFGDWGYAWDGKPGRYYVEQRHLRADLGRWMSVDPVEGEPPYAYVGNRPTWTVDPSGEQGFGAGGWDAWGRFKQEHPRGLGIPLEQFLDLVVDIPLAAGERLWHGFIEWESGLGDKAVRLLGITVESALSSSLRNSRNASVLALAPPELGPDFLRWFGGLVWGVLETAAKMVLGLPADAVRLVKYLLKQGAHILGDLLKFVCDTWASIFKALPGLPTLDEYTRGKIVGIIIASTFGLFLAGKGALALMKGLPVALRKGVEAARYLAESAAEAARGARFRIDPAYAKDAWNRTWGDIGKAYREGTKAERPVREPRGARGVSGREFAADLAGGPVRPLTTGRVRVAHHAIDVVEQHLTRFGPIEPPERVMLERLRAIADGSLQPTQWDLNFYTHELREFVRYRRMGWPAGTPTEKDAARALWNNTHTATLEDYRITQPEAEQLFHPDARQLIRQ